MQSRPCALCKHQTVKRCNRSVSPGDWSSKETMVKCTCCKYTKRNFMCIHTPTLVFLPIVYSEKYSKEYIEVCFKTITPGIEDSFCIIYFVYCNGSQPSRAVFPLLVTLAFVCMFQYILCLLL